MGSSPSPTTSTASTGRPAPQQRSPPRPQSARRGRTSTFVAFIWLSTVRDCAPVACARALRSPACARRDCAGAALFALGLRLGDRFAHVQEPAYRLGGNGAAEQPALRLRATIFGECVADLLGFDP